MDYSHFPAPPSNSTITDPNAALYAAFYQPPQNPNFLNSLNRYDNSVAGTLLPGSVLDASVSGSYGSGSSYPLVHQQHSATQTANLGLGACYPDVNAPNVVQQIGGYGEILTLPSYGREQLITLPSSTSTNPWANPAIQFGRNNLWKRAQKKKKTKVVQSAYCEVCKVDCNSKDVLEQHKMGKKHMKSLEKLKAPPNHVLIGPQENPNKGRAAQKRNGEAVEDLEAKRRKVVEGGAAAEAVKLCAMCNVVCNSDTVFRSHLAGQKHAAMAKRHGASRGLMIAAS